MKSPEIRSLVRHAAMPVFFAGGLIYLSYTGVVGEQKRISEAQPKLPGIWLDAGAPGINETKPVEPLAPGFKDKIKRYMDGFVAGLSPEDRAGKSWQLVMTELVKATVDAEEGLNVRKVPSVVGSVVRAVGNESYWKILKNQTELGTIRNFVRETNQITGEIDFWAVLPSDQQSNSDELEFVAVSRGSETYVKFESVIGPVSVKELLERLILSKPSSFDSAK